MTTLDAASRRAQVARAWACLPPEARLLRSQELRKWLKDQDTSPEILRALMARRTSWSFSARAHPQPARGGAGTRSALQAQEDVGWTNFLKAAWHNTGQQCRPSATSGWGVGSQDDDGQQCSLISCGARLGLFGASGATPAITSAVPKCHTTWQKQISRFAISSDVVLSLCRLKPSACSRPADNLLKPSARHCLKRVELAQAVREMGTTALVRKAI